MGLTDIYTHRGREVGVVESQLEPDLLEEGKRDKRGTLNIEVRGRRLGGREGEGNGGKSGA